MLTAILPIPEVGPTAGDAGDSVIAWAIADAENLVCPDLAIALLERAVAASPGDVALHAKRGNFYLDRFDFGRAAEAFETAWRLDPASTGLRLRLARCWNRLGRHEDVLNILEAVGRSNCADLHLQHGAAFAALGRSADAERLFRRALDCDPRHRQACFELCRLLRRSSRFVELLGLCEMLAAKGVAHTQFLLDWGVALACNAQQAKARDLLFDPAKISRTTLPTPQGFANLAAFNAALAEELTTNPHAITNVPTDELAMRGAARIHNLMNGNRPGLVRALLAAIQVCIEACAAQMTAAGSKFDRWRDARPKQASLHAWGLIQKSGDYEDWHTHRGGWLSGVYYVQIPEAFSVAGEGAGCIEFGPPPSLAEAGIELCAPLRVAPCEGLLLLTPSHYHHRTIPFISQGRRISVAFDVQYIDPEICR